MAGWYRRMPRYAFAFMVFTMANVGLPGTSGFVGEFLTMIGVFQVNTWVAFFAAFGVILSAGYALWLYRRVIFGALDQGYAQGHPRSRPREEIAVLVPLVVLTIFFRLLSRAHPRCDRRVGQSWSRKPLPDAVGAVAADARLRRIRRRHDEFRSIELRRPRAGLSARSLLAVGAVVLLLVGVFLPRASARLHRQPRHPAAGASSA